MIISPRRQQPPVTLSTSLYRAELVRRKAQRQLQAEQEAHLIEQARKELNNDRELREMAKALKQESVSI